MDVGGAKRIAVTQMRVASIVLCCLCCSLVLGPRPARADFPGDLIVLAWDDPSGQRGFVRAINANPLWSFASTALKTGTDGIVRVSGGKAFHVSRVTGAVTVIDVDSWIVERVIQVGTAGELRDIAIVSPSLAYVSRKCSTHLLRVNLQTGSMTESTDLSIFSDSDGLPKMEMMAVFEGRLIVQLHNDLFAPATPPRFKMQIIPETRRLVISATGAIISSTDIVLSSHLRRFNLTNGVELGPGGSVTTLFFFVPALLYQPVGNRLYWPEPNALQILDATTGELIAGSGVPFTGAPTDIALVSRSAAIPVVSVWGVVVLCGFVLLFGVVVVGRASRSKKYLSCVALHHNGVIASQRSDVETEA